MRKEPLAVSAALDRLLFLGAVSSLVIAPFLFHQELRDFADLPQRAFLQSATIFLFLLWLLKNAVSIRASIHKPRLLLPFFTFIIWSFFSLLFARNKYDGLLAVGHWAAAAIFFFLIANSLTTRKRRQLFLKSLFFAGAGTALLGIAQYLFGIDWIPQTVAPAATFANKNMAVHFIVLTFPLGLIFFLLNQKANLNRLLSVLVALMAVYLAYTQTRAGWLAVLAELLVLALLLARKHHFRSLILWDKRKTIAACLGIAVFITMIQFPPQALKGNLNELSLQRLTGNMSKLFDRAGTIASVENNSARLVIWRNSLEMVRDNFWTGVGAGNHKIFYPVYHRKAAPDKAFSLEKQLIHVHNDFLQILAETGIIGILLLCWIGWKAMRMFAAVVNTTGNEEDRLWAFGILACLVGIAVNAFFCFPLQRALPPYVVAALLGVISASNAGQHKRELLVNRKRVPAYLAVLVAVGFVWLAGFHYRSMAADHFLLEAMRKEQQGEWKEVIYHGKKAQVYNPHARMILSLTGRAYVELGAYPAGINDLQGVLRSYPYLANALLNLAVAHELNGQPREAMNAYGRALEIFPDSEKIKGEISRIERGAGQDGGKAGQQPREGQVEGL